MSETKIFNVRSLRDVLDVVPRSYPTCRMKIHQWFEDHLRMDDLPSQHAGVWALVTALIDLAEMGIQEPHISIFGENYRFALSNDDWEVVASINQFGQCDLKSVTAKGSEHAEQSLLANRWVKTLREHILGSPSACIEQLNGDVWRSFRDTSPRDKVKEYTALGQILELLAPFYDVAVLRSRIRSISEHPEDEAVDKLRKAAWVLLGLTDILPVTPVMSFHFMGNLNVCWNSDEWLAGITFKEGELATFEMGCVLPHRNPEAKSFTNMRCDWYWDTPEAPAELRNVLKRQFRRKSDQPAHAEA